MAGLSNIIEQFLKELIEEMGGVVEIQRNELASQFECAPSQINYVLSTRFTPYKGYYIESRRGGGGYIRIVKVKLQQDLSLNNIIQNIVGESLTENKAYEIIEALVDEDVISVREAEIIRAAVSDRSFGSGAGDRNSLRASVLRNILLVLVK
ncbi:MAG: CtsR family transcriptional regulator [Bacillota bacterium]